MVVVIVIIASSIGISILVEQMLGHSSMGGAEWQGPGVLLGVTGLAAWALL